MYYVNVTYFTKMFASVCFKMLMLNGGLSQSQPHEREVIAAELQFKPPNPNLKSYYLLLGDNILPPPHKGLNFENVKHNNYVTSLLY